MNFLFIRPLDSRPLTNPALQKFVIFMRVSAFLMGSLLLSVQLLIAAPGGAQSIEDVKMRLYLNNESLKTAFSKIEKQCNFLFAYKDKDVNSYNKVSISNDLRSVREILDIITAQTNLDYKQVENSIVIFRSNGSQKSSAQASSAKIQRADEPVTGLVLDDAGKPLSGATVLVKETNTSTITDAAGRFTLNASPNATLVISYVGFNSTEVAVNGRSTIQISLANTTSRLNEVVVTGYSRQSRKDITGSVAVVDVKAMRSIPTGAAEQALQGQASGVTVISSGAPGGKSNIFIRGVSSFGDNQPLVIVDGIQSDMHDLNMNDIESVQVLKDAGAASIYGVRGSNGVIIVTTKKGKAGTPVVTLDSYFGYQVPPKGNVLDIASPQAIADFVKKMKPSTLLFANGLPDYMYAGPGVSGVGKEGDPAVDPSKYVFDPSNHQNDYLIQRVNKQGTDWFHEVFKPAPTQSHTVTVSGGSDKSNFLLSMGYLNQEGSLIETYLKRYSIRANTEFRINKLRIGQNLYAFYKQNPAFNNQSQVNAIFFAYTMPSFIPVYDIKGNYGGTWAGPELGNRWNPVALLRGTANNRANTWDVVGNVYAELDFLKHFTVRTSFGGTIDNQYNYNFIPNQYHEKEQHNSVNRYEENALFNSSWTWTNTLNYSQKFGEHNLKILAGSEAIKNYGRAVGGSSSGFFSTNPTYLVLNNGTSNVTNFSNAYVNTLFSLFSRLDYSFANKYLLAATIRRDGSSRFGSANRFGVFPSFSLGWRVSQESFMKDINWINDLKLKGSWGVLGSQNNVTPTNAFTLYNSGFGTSYYDINGGGAIRQGFFQANIGNQNTGWEEDVITNIGFDATLFNNKIDLSVERYKKEIIGLLFPQPLPATTGGATAPVINIGDIENTGWDITAGYHGKVNSNFQYNISANITTYKNMIVDIPGPGYFDVGLARNQEGHPVSAFFGYDVIGFFKDASDVLKSPVQQAAAPGRFKYRDVDGNGTITPDDRTFFGNPNPDFTYGLNLGANYKNFDFAMMLYGSQGNDVFNPLRYQLNRWDDFMGAMGNEMLFHAWSPTNLNPRAPIPENSSNFSRSGSASFYKEDGSFLKCRSLILGYSISPSTLKNVGISKFRLYFQVANLFMITKYSGIDPELSSSMGTLSSSQQSAAFGIDNSNYPNNFQNFLVGLNLSF
ncbi:MAG TPA: TonB-dependent receptor [Chitinophagaceae bacterium]|nr:TonB-dependent receptor [Chitinophagaceae bacterium]